jgi:hypothetical protein
MKKKGEVAETGIPNPKDSVNHLVDEQIWFNCLFFKLLVIHSLFLILYVIVRYDMKPNMNGI